MPWAAADFDALDQQRDVEGRLGVQYVRLIASKPPIGVDLSGVANAILAGHLDNDHLLAKVMAIPEGPPADATTSAPAAPPPAAEEAPNPVQALWDTTRKVLAWQDAVLAAFIVDPPYCPIDKLPRGGRPKGQLCWQDFSAEERREAIALIYAPAERLASFRDEPAGAVAGADGGEVGAPAERVGAAASADLPAVVAGRGAVPAAAPKGGRGARATDGDAAAAG
jgi:hypothetical protein